MADLLKIQSSQPVIITDGINDQADIATTVTGSEAGLIVREARTGQTSMNESIPVVIASDQTGAVYPSDQTWYAGQTGAVMLGVRNDGASATLTTANSKYSPIAVDDRGRVHIVGSFSAIPTGTQTIVGTVTSVAAAQFTHGQSFVGTPVGSFAMAVRNDNASMTLNPANASYGAIAVDSQGRVHVVGSFSATPTGTQTVSGSVTSIPSGTQQVGGNVTATPTGTQTVTGSVTTVPSGTQNVSFSGSVTTASGAEKTLTQSFSGTPTGVFVLGVRNDGASTTLNSTNGRYGAIAVDGQGRVHVTGSFTGTQTVAGSVTSIPSGTQQVAGNVTTTPTGTQVVTGSVTSVPTGTQQVSGNVTATPTGTQTVTGSVTSIPSGTQTVAGTFTSSSVTDYNIGGGYTGTPAGGLILAVRNDNALTTLNPANASYGAIAVDSQGRVHVVGSFSATPTGTQTVAGSVTSIPSGIQQVSGNVTATPTGTQIVAGSVTSIPSGTQQVSGNVTATPIGTQTVAGSVTSIPSGTQNVSWAGSLMTTSSAEKTLTQVFSGTPSGVFILGVRNDGASTTLNSTNGRYGAIAVDSQGRVHVTGSFSATPTGTQTVAGTVTSVPSGIQQVSGAVTSIPSGTQTVAGVITSVPSGTQTIAGTVTATPSGTQTVVISGTPSVTPTGTLTVMGNVGSGVVDTGNPVKTGGVGRTSNPSAVTNGQRVDSLYDKLGRQVVVNNHIRDLVTQNSISLTGTSETTLLSAGGNGVYHDLVCLTISNYCEANVLVEIRDTPGGSVKLAFCVAATGGGAVVPFAVPLPQDIANRNWTAKCDVAPTSGSIRVFVQAVKNV